MRIAYVGNYQASHCTEVHLARTLEDLGHVVTRLQENGYTSQELGNILAQGNYELFLFTRTWGETVTLEHLAQLRERNIPSASYHLDLYVGLSRKYLHGDNTLETMLQTDPFWRTDYVFTPDGDAKSAEVFKANGVNHVYIKPGVFKPECYITEAQFVGNTPEQLSVLFVGGGDKLGSPNIYGHPEWNYRNELIQWLYDTYGERFTKYGHPERTIRNAELNELYANSGVVVGDSVCLGGFTHTHYWSDRVYETIGRGGFLIHPYIKGLDEEFVDGETIVFYEYGNWQMLKDKIDYYLEHDEEREKIRHAGQAWVRENATYHDRMEQMISLISATDKVPTPLSVAPIKINMGAGSEPDLGAGWVNVDHLALPGIQVVHNLLHFPYPFNDGVAEHIKAIDLLEHLPNYTPDYKPTTVAFIEECHRILQPGGTLFIQVPHWQSPNMWIDPTHVRGYDPKSLDYFDPETDFGKWYGYYSEKKFRVSVEEYNGNLRFTLRKR